MNSKRRNQNLKKKKNKKIQIIKATPVLKCELPKRAKPNNFILPKLKVEVKKEKRQNFLNKWIKNPQAIVGICLIITSILLAVTNVVLASNKDDNLVSKPQKVVANNEKVELEDINVNDYYQMDKNHIDFNKLQNINSDTVGWLNIPGTKINYPIVQGNNNTFYNNHTYNKKENNEGWIYVDSNNSLDILDENTIIYGQTNGGNTLLSSLNATIEPSWYINRVNRKFTIQTANRTQVWQVVSVYKTTKEDLLVPLNFKTKSEHLAYIDNIVDKSVFTFNNRVDEDDKMLSLVLSNQDESVIVLQAKLFALE